MEVSLLAPLDDPGLDNQQSDAFIQKTLVDAVRHLDSPEALDRCYSVSIRLSENATTYVFHTPIAGTLKSVKILSDVSNYDFVLSQGETTLNDDTIGSAGLSVLFDGESEMAADEFLTLTTTEAITAGILTVRFRPQMRPRNA